jgi:crotonobetainyl-CoA:carnitine CoA-transferase CaiB-like acyl-CoA transferase
VARTGNQHGGLAISPYNVYATRDGYVALACVVENHWPQLLGAMGREDLKDDPRFATNAKRCAHMAETDAIVSEWTRRLTSQEIFEATKRCRVPCSPVRNLLEVMHDRHMHERGMLEWIDHPVLGRIVVPTTPLRLHGAPRVQTAPSPSLGEHNSEIYGDWLGLPAAEIEKLKADGVI